MEDKNCKIEVNVIEGAFSVSGSEFFVDKICKDLLSFFKEKKDNVFERRTLSNNEVDNREQHVDEKEYVDELKKYIDGGLVSIDEDDHKIRIHAAKIPGGSKAEKCRNIALIYGFAKSNTFSNKEIIELCEYYDCYDSGNFSSYFKKDQRLFIIKGEGQGWEIKLNVNGKQKAISLMDEMLNDANK